MEGINEIQLSDLSGKKIVIDISIYMYKYKSENKLIEGMFEMFLLLLCNNITPILVFDGKPPPEKSDVIEYRRNTRKAAEAEYVDTLKKFENSKIENNKKAAIQLRNLRRSLVRVNKDDILEVKKLANIMGITYYESDGESDIVCANLVINEGVYACMSDDMDMFVYGCPRILRYFSLFKKTIVLYDLSVILKDLNISFINFKIICVIAGTDYNFESAKNYNFEKSINIYNKYLTITNHYEYLNWLYINNVIDDKKSIIKIIDMFNSNNITINNSNFNNSEFDHKKIIDYLGGYGYIFVN